MTSRLAMLWQLMRGQRIRYGAAMMAIGLASLLINLPPLVVRAAIDELLDGGKTADQSGYAAWLIAAVWGQGRTGPLLLLAGLAILILTGLSGLFAFLRGRWSALASESIARNLRNRLYEHLQHLPCSYHEKAQTGDLVQRCTSDVETVRTFYATQVVEIARAIALVLVALPILLSLDGPMALVSMSLLPVIVLFAARFFSRVQASFQAMDEAEGAMTTVLQENLTGIRVVRAFARQAYERDKFERVNAAHRSLNDRLFRLMAVYWAVSDFLCFQQMLIVLLAAAWRVSHGQVSVGTLVAFLTYAGTFIWPLRQMGRVLTEMGKAMVAVGRIQEILAQPLESAPASPPAALPERVAGSITFRNVTFRHGQKTILDGVSFSVHAGETLAILGPSGSGKSTIVNLLLRFHDYDSGSITLDNLELNRLDRKDVRRQCGVVMQEPFLYSKTLRENIRLGRREADDRQIVEAARVAAIHDSIEEFNDQYDTLVGERGVTLSGGQRQRVAIARAILQDPPILILDDAFSAVDTKTETAILEALKRRRGRRTTLVIAHRLSTLMQADRIIVLEHGRITQGGTPAQLAGQEGLYRRLWQIQGALEDDLRNELTEKARAGSPAESLDIASTPR